MNLKFVLGLFALASLSGCATLPSTGPTGSQIEDTANDFTDHGLNITIVPVKTAEAIPSAMMPVEWQLSDVEAQPTDTIAAGDVLSITVFEAGVALFAGDAPSAAGGGGGGFDPSVRSQTLPPRRVDDYGYIDVPYVGRVEVSGSTIADAEVRIRSRLRGLSQDPQVVIAREEIIGNSIIIGGEVTRPGRLILQTNRESLADIVALSGGYRGQLRDLVLQVERGDEVARLRLSDIMSSPYSRLQAFPGDRLTVLADPMTFTVLGASGRVQQMPFTRERMSVVEAIAMAGGPRDDSGDPQAVFLFRFAGKDGGEPTVYHFNMMEAPTYFLAQQFFMRDKDVLYFGNSASNQPRKLIQTIGQLFSPIVTATAVANNINAGN